MIVITLIIFIIIVLIIIFVYWGIRRQNCQNNDENSLHMALKMTQSQQSQQSQSQQSQQQSQQSQQQSQQSQQQQSQLKQSQQQQSQQLKQLKQYNNDSNANNLLKISKIQNISPNNIKYRGGIDNDISDINKSLCTNNVFLENGHPELTRNGSANSIFNKTDKFAPITHIKNQDHIDILDYDEQNANQSLTRNDPYRPINGIIQRIKMVDPYLREELEKESKKEWWGNGEY